MKRRLPLLVVLVLAACKSDPPQVASDSGSAAAPAPSAPDAAAGPRADAGARASRAARDGGGSGFTSAERAAFLKPLDLGRKKSRAKDFNGALAEFDRALVIAPDDVRVLAEVGWAALNAGDLPRAQLANRRALALAKDPTLRAQVLYNSGRVSEALKDPEAARKSYAESLGLRDNAEVKRRLAAVGGPPDDSLTCAGGAPTIEALCTCLLGAKDAPMVLEGEAKACAADPSSLTLGTPRFLVVRYGSEGMGERRYQLASREGAALRPVAELGADFEPGAFGVHNQAKVNGGELRKIGSRSVLVVRSEQDNSDFNMAGLELCTDVEQLETVCATGEGAGKARCFKVPVSISAGCGPGAEVDPADLDADTRATLTELKASWHHSDVKLSWSIADDGKLVVQKKSGDSGLLTSGFVGVHPLF